jgi:hypothetical protein
VPCDWHGDLVVSTSIDDLPSIGIQRLRASGAVRPETTRTTIRLGETDFTGTRFFYRGPGERVLRPSPGMVTTLSDGGYIPPLTVM